MTTSKKEPTTFGSLSEDIIPFIAGFIKSWAEVRAVGKDWTKERRISRRSRDSALRAISLSTRANYSRWIPYLLEEVTLTDSTLPNLFFLLADKPNLADFIETLRFTAWPEDADKEDYTQVTDLWNRFSAAVGKNLTQFEFVNELITGFLQSFNNLQTLILEGLAFSFPLVDSSTGKPFKFLVTSLKRLYIGNSGSQSTPTMGGQNVIWLLVFCPCLSQIVLAFQIDLPSFKYLEEYVTTFRGRSNIRQVALYPHFVWHQVSQTGRGSWSGFKGPQNLVGNNFETHSIFNLLQVTNNHLKSLEIIGKAFFQVGSHNAFSRIYPDCLEGLLESRHSIKHLRLVLDRDEFSNFKYSIFKNLKIVAFDVAELHRLKLHPSLGSDSVEVLHLICYLPGEACEEESNISEIIEKEVFPNLREVWVPLHFVELSGTILTSPEHSKQFKGARARLKSKQAFKSGKIQLKTLDLGETIGDASKGEDCLSALFWASPFPVSD